MDIRDVVSDLREKYLNQIDSIIDIVVIRNNNVDYIGVLAEEYTPEIEEKLPTVFRGHHIYIVLERDYTIN